MYRLSTNSAEVADRCYYLVVSKQYTTDVTSKLILNSAFKLLQRSAIRKGLVYNYYRPTDQFYIHNTIKYRFQLFPVVTNSR